MNTRTYSLSRPMRRQRGAVLMVTLMFLVVLTLLGISAINTTMLETKLAANMQERNRAFQMAETALSESEWVFDDDDQLFAIFTATDRTIVLDNPAPIAIDEDHGLNSEVIAGRTEAAFRGEFRPPAGMSAKPENIHSLKSFIASYYEVVTVGKNTDQVADNQAIQVHLRSGYRRLVPIETE